MCCFIVREGASFEFFRLASRSTHALGMLFCFEMRQLQRKCSTAFVTLRSALVVLYLFTKMFELAIGDYVRYVIEFLNDIAQSTSLRTARRIFQYKRAYFYPPVGDS